MRLLTKTKPVTKDRIQAERGNYMGHGVTKPVFGVSDKARLKPISSATKTRWKIEISLVASLDMKLFKKQITKR